MRRRVFLASGMLSAGVALAALRGRSPAESALKASRSVALSAFGSDGGALQRAIDTAADEVVIDIDAVVATDIRLRSDQTLRFDGGRIIVATGARFKQAVFNGYRVSNVTLTDPVIDANTRLDGVTALRLVDSNTVRIGGGRLIRANLIVESYDSAVTRAIDVTGLVIEMRGYRSTAVYLSGVRGVRLRNVECSGGREGIGVYNHARAIDLSGVISHGHQQDGFVIIAGQDIHHEDCRSYANGQSGFTTQRQTGGEDSRFATWTRCRAWGNTSDGFDIRGATDRPWKVTTGFTLQDCMARANGATGFYVVQAEGTTLRSCTAILNRQQNLFIDTSDGVVVDDFQAVSGAADVAPGPNKAGILVYNSAAVRIGSTVSNNEQGRTQQFGLSFTGSSRGGKVIGGSFLGTAQPAVVLPEGNIMLAS